jgi:hypothetical protein
MKCGGTKGALSSVFLSDEKNVEESLRRKKKKSFFLTKSQRGKNLI